MEEFKRIADERGISKVDLEKELIGLREQVKEPFFVHIHRVLLSGEFKASLA